MVNRAQFLFDLVLWSFRRKMKQWCLTPHSSYSRSYRDVQLWNEEIVVTKQTTDLSQVNFLTLGSVEIEFYPANSRFRPLRLQILQGLILTLQCMLQLIITQPQNNRDKIQKPKYYVSKITHVFGVILTLLSENILQSNISNCISFTLFITHLSRNYLIKISITPKTCRVYLMLLYVWHLEPMFL